MRGGYEKIDVSIAVGLLTGLVLIVLFGLSIDAAVLGTAALFLLFKRLEGRA